MMKKCVFGEKIYGDVWKVGMKKSSVMILEHNGDF